LRVDSRLKFGAVPKVVVVEAGAVGDAELLAVEIEFVAVDYGPQSSRGWRQFNAENFPLQSGQRKFAGEDAGLQRWRVWLPVRADEIFREGALDAGEAEDGFGIARIHGIPKAPEIFERGVTAAIEEGVLEAVGLSRVKRSVTLIMWRGSSQRVLLTIGVNGYATSSR